MGKRNDFQENTNTAFRSLRNDTNFSDITLVSEDGQQLEAHKVILAVFSPFFNTMLKRNKHPHPLIYMRGMKSEDLVAMVDFFYYGEANVYQLNIDAFLAIAEELKLKGLTGNGNGDKEKEEEVHKGNTYKEIINPKFKKDPNSLSHEIIFQKSAIENDLFERAVAVTTFAVSGDLQELEDKIN